MIKAHLDSLIKKYDIFLLDQWGVLHNGKEKYERVDKFINILKKNKKKIILISNTSQIKNDVIKQTLEPIGFNIKDFTEIITSGQLLIDIKYNKIKDELKLKKILNQKKCFLISNRNDSRNIKQLEIKATKISEAKFVFAMSLNPNSNKSEITKLEKKINKFKLPMICTNPDKHVFDGNKNKKCFQIGFLAEMYKKNKGDVKFIGKPKKLIFNHILKNFSKKQVKKTVIIGDSLETDIAGGNKSKISTLLILDGIHKNEFNKNYSSKKIKKICSSYGIIPTYFSHSINNLF